MPKYLLLLGTLVCGFGAIDAGLNMTMAQPACGANAEKSGTFEGSGKTVGFIAGVKWGSGILTLADGRTFNFSVKGLKAR